MSPQISEKQVAPKPPRFTDHLVKDTDCSLAKKVQLCLPVWVQHIGKVVYKSPSCRWEGKGEAVSHGALRTSLKGVHIPRDTSC